MEVHLVSYANTYADVDDHVGFGVDPPVIANFFRLLSLGFGRIFTINRCICPTLDDKPIAGSCLSTTQHPITLTSWAGKKEKLTGINCNIILAKHVKVQKL